MITIILFAIIGAIGLAIKLFKDFGAGVILPGLITGVALGAGAGFLVALAIPTKTEIVTEEYALEAIADNHSINRPFILGTGRIKSDMKYYAYVNDGGRIRMISSLRKNTFIVYNDTPKVEIETKKQVNEWWNHFSIYDSCECDDTYTYHVPEGSIANDYTLDLN